MSMTHDDVTRAARALIAVEPPQDLEARISRRLDAVTPLPQKQPWSRYFLAATVTAGLVVALVNPEFRSSEVPEFRSSEVPEFRSSGVPEFRSAEVRNLGTSEPRNLGTPGLRNLGTPGLRKPGTSTSLTEQEREWMSRRIPALEPIDEIVMGHVVLEPIQPEPVLITPLTMTPLMTSPMYGDPDEGRQ